MHHGVWPEPCFSVPFALISLVSGLLSSPFLVSELVKEKKGLYESKKKTKLELFRYVTS